MSSQLGDFTQRCARRFGESVWLPAIYKARMADFSAEVIMHVKARYGAPVAEAIERVGRENSRKRFRGWLSGVK